MADAPVYFELSWAILSTIGLLNVFFGVMVVSITIISPISLVPIIVSVAGAVANGLCYYAYYANYPQIPTAVASAFADAFWLVQEAGMSFYSYLILIHILQRPQRPIFIGLFWSLIAALVVIRGLVLTSRVRLVVANRPDLQPFIDHLHVGYFGLIAVIECLSAFFLLQKLATALRQSVEASAKPSLFRYLMRSTEIRLSTLALVGISRAITYSFQTTSQSANSVASQIDRFVYTLECLFPVMMFIDILASRVVVAKNTYGNSSQFRSRERTGGGATQGPEEFAMYSQSQVETRIKGGRAPTSSQEHITGSTSHSGSQDEDDIIKRSIDVEASHGGINKTVQFEVRESSL